MKGRSEKIIINFLMIVLLMTPLIDFLNGVIYYMNFQISYSPGQLIRIPILIISIVLFMLYKKSNMFITIVILLSFFIQIYFISLEGYLNLSTEFGFVSKIFYNVFFILLVNQIYDKKIFDEKKIFSLVLINGFFVSFVIIFSKVTNIGMAAYGENIGHKGFFIGLNDVTAVVVMTLPFILIKLKESRKKLLYVIFIAMNILTLVILGTKTALVFLVLIMMYSIFNMISSKNTRVLGILITFLMFVAGAIFLRYYYSEFSATIIQRNKYFYRNMNLVSYILSGRNDIAKIAFDFWIDNPSKWLFGVGFFNGSKVISYYYAGHGMIEMDLIDVLYFYGIVACLIISTIIFKSMYKALYIIVRKAGFREKVTAFNFIGAFIISFLGGHVILSPLSGIYFAIICGIVNKHYKTLKGEIAYEEDSSNRA